MTMPKNKRPVPRKPNMPPPEDHEVLAQTLADLAQELAGQEGGPARTPERDEFDKQVRNALRKKHDEVLYGAIELARFSDVAAYQLLRSEIEEAAASVTLRRDGAAPMEIHAFAVPLFVHSRGGLKQEQCFQDEAAFGALVASFQEAELESRHARVVLVSHAYDAGEADSVSYSQLGDMLRDAAASMSDKKLVATPALERSITGWADSQFGPDDQAVELRYLLGFALKPADDPFYQAPADPVAADAWFEQRMARYRAWTEGAAPLLRRCLAARPDELTLHFLYQDLFFGAREQGAAELAMLALMSELNGALQARPDGVAGVRAIVAPAIEDEEMVLRVRLEDAAGAELALAARPLDVAADLQAEVDDLCDALATLGMASISVGQRFGTDGAALDLRPWPGARA